VTIYILSEDDADISEWADASGVSYSEYDAPKCMVVIAASEPEARKLASEAIVSGGGEARWLDPRLTNCRPVDGGGGAKVLVSGEEVWTPPLSDAPVAEPFDAIAGSLVLKGRFSAAAVDVPFTLLWSERD
jgi:hypothetical protein